MCCYTHISLNLKQLLTSLVLVDLAEKALPTKSQQDSSLSLTAVQSPRHNFALPSKAMPAQESQVTSHKPLHAQKTLLEES
jgi:hypothetical protein